MPGLSEDDVQKVLKALADQRFKWRTVNGLAKDSGLDVSEVRQILKAKEELIVQSSVPSTKGEDLFTLRELYSTKESLGSQLLGAFKGRAR